LSDVHVHLSFPAKADYLILARLALSGLARDLALDDELLADLKLAVTEACGNATRHAYPDGDGEVSVSYLVRDRASIELIVEDQGVGLHAAGGSDGVAAPRGEGQMGMSILRTIADELAFHRGADGRGTVVHITKRLPGTGA
jgi:anti-sigma regulatory factor (Ser/Thr protein kinase)